ncbi:MAG: hypothetical protein FJ398_06910 [Verrucomicrobia bacterium]|nr:hypothetical protein [Verrucomicrobiota bacterium]
MTSKFDESDFVDTDYQSTRSQATASLNPAQAASGFPNRLPTREELEARVGETQQRLAELKRAQEQLERERAALEEARRRRVELQTGREEMLQHLTRGVGLLEKAETDARTSAEQMAKTLTGLREALANVQSIQEQTWNQENWNVELTRALTTIENSRMEWNQARLKWPLLEGEDPLTRNGGKTAQAPGSFWEGKSFGQLCRLGFALTWPVACVGLLGLIAWLIFQLR